jgi:hypothetical protein
MSTKVMRAGMTVAELAICARLAKRASGTLTSPTFGSMVQNGKFAACAEAVLVSALNKVDLPTFGKPTIPILKPMMHSFIFKPLLSAPVQQSKQNCVEWAAQQISQNALCLTKVY